MKSPFTTTRPYFVGTPPGIIPGPLTSSAYPTGISGCSCQHPTGHDGLGASEPGLGKFFADDIMTNIAHTAAIAVSAIILFKFFSKKRA